MARALWTLGALSVTGSAALAEESTAAAADPIDTIQVIGVTPLHGVGLPLEKIPANVQSATSADLDRAESLDITSFMDRTLGSVTLNAGQNNPLQPDLQFRGFTASPLVGAAQGLTVYLNGVRFNDVFADNVNWDLLPESIVDSMNLISGANPLFGLNTLGGALSLQTKNGFNSAQTSVESYGGAFGRRLVSADSGGNNGEFGYFVNIRQFAEDGWRDASPSAALNVFASVGWHSRTTTVDVDFLFGQSSLTGNGTAPVELLRSDRAAIFTSPDETANAAKMLIIEATHWFAPTVQVAGNAYYRDTSTDTQNGDASGFTADGAGFLLNDAGAQVTDKAGTPLSEAFNAVNNRQQRRQHSYGTSGQATFLHSVFGHDNQLITGFGWSDGVARFRSAVEAVHFRSDRSVDETGLLVADGDIAANTRNTTVSGFFSDTLNLVPNVDLTVSGRYDHTTISIDDPVGNNPDIAGVHRYGRFNPAAGLTWQVAPAVNVFAGYSESARAPTPVELTCADPTVSCRLSSAFVNDPPLKAVVAASYEIGARGALWHNQWNIGYFRTTNADDILFQSTGGATGNIGFFTNVGDTRREGVELGLRGKFAQRATWYANYSHVNATFRDAFTENSPNHPLADAHGQIEVHAGNHLPGIPPHSAKGGIDFQITSRLTIGPQLVVNAGQYLRGDEANLLSTTAAYVVFNLHGTYTINKHLSAFVILENLFDRDYETFGALGQPSAVPFVPFTGFRDPRFLGPAPPLGGWIGVRLTL